MCVAEPGRVLQTIPKQTINADVSGPNQSVRHQRELLERHCPGIHLSDGRGKEGPINRCGNPIVRWTLVEMVWRLMIWQPNYGPVRLLATGLVKSKRAKKRLVIAAARRVAIDLWRLSTGQTTPEKLGLVMQDRE
jgi:hypothetical protein